MKSKRLQLIPYLFILPNVVIFLVFVVVPALYGFALSFTRWDVISEPVFVGVGNYISIFTSSSFWETTQRTLVYVLTVVPLTYVVSLLLALLVDSNMRLRTLMRAFFYVPAMLSAVVIGVSWRWIFGDYFGIINYFIERYGGTPINWLTTPGWAMLVVILASVWARAGYYMVMFLAGLQGIPEVYYEAAKIDGASRWQQFWRITLPLLKPTSLVVLVLCSIESFKVFDLIVTLTTGGPGRATTFLVQDIYRWAFQRGDLGYASAMSVVLLLILGLLTVFQFRLTGIGGDAYE
ncbi:MAG TPA: sugar ABC transporter permease [Limnochordia bacterium]|nr:sugar ABC transporter permease [Limnochordia bacterium]